METPQLRILVVDDHRDTTDMLARLLRKAGYHVATAITYAEASRLCDGDGDGHPHKTDGDGHPHKAGDGDGRTDGDGRIFDLLLADTDLPNGDGLQLLQLLRDQLGAAIRGVVLSGFHDPNTIARAKRMGFDEYLIKPASFPEILEALKRTAAHIPPRHDGDGDGKLTDGKA